MKIAYLVHDYHRSGGHSRYVAELATRFAREHEVHVFANRIEPDHADRIQFHTVPAWRANALTTVLSFALPVTVQVGRHFDIIHSQGFCGFRGNVFTGHICNRAWHLALKQLEGGVTFRESVFNAVATTLEHGIYRFSGGAVVAISELVARDLSTLYHCRAPIHVIHHGVDLQLFSPEGRNRWRSAVRKEHGLQDDDMVFLYVGDLRKGAARCIQALSRLQRGTLLFVSRTPAARYECMVHEAGVDFPVRFAGSTDKIERIYAAADAFVLPTPYDAFGMVVSEAMSSGLPVIVSRHAGAAELILSGINGLLLENVSDVGELAAHMSLLLNDPSRAREIGRAARKSVESMSWDAVAERTMRVYQQLLRSAN